jgi:hypothetical protein
MENSFELGLKKAELKPLDVPRGAVRGHMMSQEGSPYQTRILRWQARTSAKNYAL